MILDIIIYIAEFNPKAWYELTHIYDVFNKYSRSFAGIAHYKEIFTEKKTDIYGNISYYLLGKLHRDYDLPARIYANDSCGWFINGNLHRDNDLPARIRADGSRE
jgi:hypothetical protein